MRRLKYYFCIASTNFTHLAQLLDVVIKRHWRQIIGNQNTIAEGRREPSIPTAIFPKLLKKLAEAMQPNAKNNLIIGF